jgi:pyridoxal phosphate enzyme (YggS family)
VLTASEIATRLTEVRSRIGDASRRARRPPDSVRLVLATKTQPSAALVAAYHAGAREFGENYVQEAQPKHAVLAAMPDIRWHMIGHLQTNKARAALEIFDLLQTLDNPRLAATLYRLQPSPPMPVLIEVNLGGEASKTGVAPEAVEVLIDAVRGQVEVAGLMTIPPPVANPEAAGPFFARLRELRDRLAGTCGLALSELSMGMTDDFEIAIEEGTSMVRVGRAVFGERP